MAERDSYQLGTSTRQNMPKNNKKVIIVAVVIVIALIAIATGLVLAFSGNSEQSSDSEWTEWSKCTVTCGLGQQVRSRIINETEIETKACQHPTCLTGDQQIDIEAQKARDNGFSDNLFLSRFAKTVNSRERTRRSADNQTEFYGLWKMTETQLKLVFDEVSDDQCDGYCRNLISNLNVSVPFYDFVLIIFD